MIEHDIKTIDVHELKQLMETQQNLCLIDVRELHEWKELRIPGAVHIPKDNITEKIESTMNDKTNPIYLHCRSGVRSLYAAQKLLEIGYKEVYSIAGGIMDWVNSGYHVIE